MTVTVIESPTPPAPAADVLWFQTGPDGGHFYVYESDRSRWETPYCFELMHSATVSISAGETLNTRTQQEGFTNAGNRFFRIDGPFRLIDFEAALFADGWTNNIQVGGGVGNTQTFRGLMDGSGESIPGTPAGISYRFSVGQDSIGASPGWVVGGVLVVLSVPTVAVDTPLTEYRIKARCVRYYDP